LKAELKQPAADTESIIGGKIGGIRGGRARLGRGRGRVAGSTAQDSTTKEEKDQRQKAILGKKGGDGVTVLK